MNPAKSGHHNGDEADNCWKPLQCDCCGFVVGTFNEQSGDFKCTTESRAARRDKLMEVTPKPNVRPSELNSSASESLDDDECHEAFELKETSKITTTTSNNDFKLVNYAVIMPMYVPKYQNVSGDRFMYYDMEYSNNLSQTSKKINIEIVYTWTPTRFTVNAVLDTASLHTKLDKLLREHAASTSPGYQPVQDELVVAKKDGRYHRARVAQLDGRNIRVVFIDCGGWAVGTTANLRPSNAELFKLPVYGMIVHVRTNFNSKDKEPNLAVPASSISVYHDIRYNMQFKMITDKPTVRGGEPFIRLSRSHKFAIETKTGDVILFAADVIE